MMLTKDRSMKISFSERVSERVFTVRKKAKNYIIIGLNFY